MVEIGFLKEYLRMLDEGVKKLAKKIASLQFPSKPPIEHP
jgi:hypothetical protein